MYLSEDRQERQQHEPRQHASREHRARNRRTDDVTDAEVLGGDVDIQCRVRELASRRRRIADLGAKQVEDPRQRFPKGSHAEAAEHESGELAAALTCDEHLGACGALRIRKRAVLLHDQRAAQGHHHQDAEEAARESQHRDLKIGEVCGSVRRQEDEGRNREHHSARHRLASGSDGLDDVVFEDGGAPKALQHRDGEHGDGNRGAHGQACAEPEVDGRRAEQETEQHAEDDRLRGELGR